MLRRLDYTTDVLGGVAAHYCYDHVTIRRTRLSDFAARCKAHAGGPLLSGRTSFILDYTDLAVRE